MLSEERDVDRDDNGCHYHAVKHANDLSGHFNKTLSCGLAFIKRLTSLGPLIQE